MQAGLRAWALVAVDPQRDAGQRRPARLEVAEGRRDEQGRVRRPARHDRLRALHLRRQRSPGVTRLRAARSRLRGTAVLERSQQRIPVPEARSEPAAELARHPPQGRCRRQRQDHRQGSRAGLRDARHAAPHADHRPAVEQRRRVLGHGLLPTGANESNRRLPRS